MNIMTWFAVAVGVGATLMLLLLVPATEDASTVAVEEAPTSTAVAVTTQYWSPVTASAPTVQQQAAPQVRTQPCSTCGASAVSQPVPTQMQAQPCSTCGAETVATTVPVVRTVPVSPTCMQVPASACGERPCSGLQAYGAYGTCGTPCGSACPLAKPGINRNFNLCVEECTFIQLHSTVSQPICSNVCFQWTASKGSFLDPTASDPVFYAPTTQFANGEDVWVVLKITDGTGAQFTDQVKVHVINRR